MAEVIFYDSRYVKKSGDTMTGNLTMDGTNSVQFGDSDAAINSSGSGNLDLNSTQKIYLTTGNVVMTANSLDLAAVTRTELGAGLEATPSLVFASDTDTGIFSPTTNNIAFSSGGTEILRIATAVQISAVLQPDANNTRDIGTSSRRFKNIYYAGQLQSNVSTGTAPAVCSSTTVVTNWNADMVDGRHVGTSGATIPLCNTSNTWGASQTFSTSSKLMDLINSVGGVAFSFSSTSGNVFTIGTTTGSFFTLSNAAGIVVNEDSVNAFDFRVESDTNTHAIFVDSGSDAVGILNSTPAFALDINGICNTAGTSGKTYRWNAATTAPATTLGITAVNRYGGDTNYLGDPTGWILVNVAGTDRKVPFYAV